jgi:hypothetical protein
MKNYIFYLKKGLKFIRLYCLLEILMKIKQKYIKFKLLKKKKKKKGIRRRL